MYDAVEVALSLIDVRDTLTKATEKTVVGRNCIVLVLVGLFSFGIVRTRLEKERGVFFLS